MTTGAIPIPPPAMQLPSLIKKPPDQTNAEPDGFNFTINLFHPLSQQTLPGHFLRLGKPQHLQHGRRNIGQAATFAQFHTLLAVIHQH